MNLSALFRSASVLHAGLFVLAATVVALAASPPFLPETWRAVVMSAFAPSCHQLPARSPHIGGVPIAVCDRCSGIYLGVALGMAVARLAHPVWKRVRPYRHHLLLAALAPLGLDWIAGVLGLGVHSLWSRAATGLGFGLTASSFMMHTLLARAKTSSERFDDPSAHPAETNPVGGRSSRPSDRFSD